MLLTNSSADLWVVQKDTQGPYAEASSLRDDLVRYRCGPWWSVPNPVSQVRPAT
jgi:hypothetical protein